MIPRRPPCEHLALHEVDGAGMLVYACSHCGECYPCRHTREYQAWRCRDGTERRGCDAGVLPAYAAVQRILTEAKVGP